ncbi:MAG: hypothetical protein EZS28_055713, partial [Streblomastix strix]
NAKGDSEPQLNQ